MKTAFIIWFAFIALCAAFASGYYTGYLSGQNAPARIYQPPRILPSQSIVVDLDTCQIMK